MWVLVTMAWHMVGLQMQDLDSKYGW